MNPRPRKLIAIVAGIALVTLIYRESRNMDPVEPSAAELPPHRMTMIDQLGKILAKSYPEFEDLPDDEHFVRFMHSWTRDMREFAANTDAENPNESPALLMALRQWDAALRREHQFFDTLIDEARFQRTEPEIELTKQLRNDSVEQLGKVTVQIESH